MKIVLKILIILFVLCLNLQAQITVAIADFENNSGIFNLDYWEKAIPDFLKSELSKSNRLIIVERNRLDNVLKEQALGMTGMIDSSKIQQVGNLIGAQYIIQGRINKSGNRTRIDADIIKVESGEIKNEKVIAPNSDNINEMIILLSNNIRNLLTGDVSYKKNYQLDKYPTTYFLAATAGLTVATILINNSYQDKLDIYNAETKLSGFDTKYDDANSLNKWKIVAASAAGVALVGTIYCWYQNITSEDILAYNRNSGFNVIPNLAFNSKGGVNAGVSIYF